MQREPAGLQGGSASLWVSRDWEAGQLPQVAEGQVVPGRQRLGFSRRDLLRSNLRTRGWGTFL